jgi:hypothetical protein
VLLPQPGIVLVGSVLRQNFYDHVTTCPLMEMQPIADKIKAKLQVSLRAVCPLTGRCVF